MKFLADECCDAGLVDALRTDGHDVSYVFETQRGAADSDILHKARSEDRILLTEDKDFGELVYRLQQPAYGIVLLRFDVGERSWKVPRLRDLLANHAERLPGHFVVLKARKFRIRPLR